MFQITSSSNIQAYLESRESVSNSDKSYNFMILDSNEFNITPRKFKVQSQNNVFLAKDRGQELKRRRSGSQSYVTMLGINRKKEMDL